jgi:aldehyde:ferredoxin oxidoreductase
MRKAGFWVIDIKGVAESPTYLVIRDDQIDFKDATSLWGMETAAAQGLMLKGLQAAKAATVGIGPAGEGLIKYAALFGEGDLYRCFGRGGAGCVMRSDTFRDDENGIDSVVNDLNVLTCLRLSLNEVKQSQGIATSLPSSQ